MRCHSQQVEDVSPSGSTTTNTGERQRGHALASTFTPTPSASTGSARSKHRRNIHAAMGAAQTCIRSRALRRFWRASRALCATARRSRTKLQRRWSGEAQADRVRRRRPADGQNPRSCATDGLPAGGGLPPGGQPRASIRPTSSSTSARQRRSGPAATILTPDVLRLHAPTAGLLRYGQLRERWFWNEPKSSRMSRPVHGMRAPTTRRLGYSRLRKHEPQEPAVGDLLKAEISVSRRARSTSAPPSPSCRWPKTSKTSPQRIC